LISLYIIIKEDGCKDIERRKGGGKPPKQRARELSNVFPKKVSMGKGAIWWEVTCHSFWRFSNYFPRAGGSTKAHQGKGSVPSK